MLTKKSVNDLAYKIVGCAIEVHKHLGPGLLESIYEECMLYELEKRGLQAKSQLLVPVFYDGVQVKIPLKLDLIVNDTVIVELKAVDQIASVHKAQLMTYLKLTKKPKGLIINFNTDNITKSAIPLVNEYFAALPEY
jgi:GxxExxY protein